MFYNRLGKNVLNKQLWCYVFVICKIELILMSALSHLVTSSLHLFNRFFV